MSIGASTGTPTNGSEAHAAWLEANRGAAIDDRATLAAFMDEEAEAFGRGPVDAKTTDAIADSFAGPLLALMPVHDRLGRDDYALLRGAMHAGLAAIGERFAMSASVPSLARALVATS